jgi:hypothetical protein
MDGEDAQDFDLCVFILPILCIHVKKGVRCSLRALRLCESSIFPTETPFAKKDGNAERCENRFFKRILIAASFPSVILTPVSVTGKTH